MKKKLEKNPNLKIKLEHPEPAKVELSTILDVHYDPNMKINSLPAYIGHSQDMANAMVAGRQVNAI